MRVAVGQISQESNSFVSMRTELDLFRNSYLHEGDALLGLAGTSTEVAGFLDVLGEAGLDVAPLLATRCTSYGPLSVDCWQTLRTGLLERLRAALPVDGVLVSVHGAMLADGEDDPEGDLLAEIRAIVGADVPVMATLDLHAHVTHRMIDHADALVSYAHYPHDDVRETGQRAARLMARTLAGEIRLAMALAKVPIVLAACNGQTFGDAPMAHLTARARELERDPAVLSVSCFHVQPNLDVPGLGMGAVVVTNGDPARAEAEAATLAHDFWARRESFLPEALSVAEAVRRGREQRPGPVLLVDTADCVGGGAAGDSVALLRELLAIGVEEPSYVMVVDPDAAAACHAAGTGAEVSLTLGHRVDPRWGEPLAVTGRVRSLHDGRFVYTGGLFGGTEGSMGPSAVLSVGAVQVLIASLPTYDWADEQYRSAGLDPRDARFIGAKNPMNYRFAYRDVAVAAYVLDTPGPTPADITRLEFTRLDRPAYPFDPDMPEPRLDVHVRGAG